MRSIFSFLQQIRAQRVRIIVVPLALAAFSISNPVSAGGETESAVVSGRIEGVTVYSDRALVRRTQTIKFASNQMRLRFVELPASLIQDTIRASAEGLTIASIAVRPSDQMQDTFLEEHPLKKRIQELDEEIRTEVDRQTNVREQMKTLNSFGQLTTAQSDRELRQNSLQIKGWLEAMRFIEDQRLGYMQKLQTSEKKLAELRKSHKIVSEKFARVTSARVRSPVDVELVCVGKPGSAGTVHLDYMVTGVSWKGIYDMHGKSEGGEFRLESIATLKQKTGEDWSDVRITLSTARPSLAMMPGSIKPWRVHAGSIAMAGGKDSAGDDGQLRSTTASSAESPDSADVSTFTVQLPGFESIPGDNSDHRVVINQSAISGNVTHVAVPTKSSFVFLKGKFKNTTTMPLLWNAVNVYLDGGFVGNTTLASKASVGEDFEMFFGTDQRMQLKRTLLKGEITETGILSTSVEIQNQWQIEVSNYSKKPKEVLIMDQFPISADPAIRTKFLGSNRQDVKTDANGILTWTVTVAPGQTQKVDFSYNLMLPREMWTSFEQAEEKKVQDNMNETNAPMPQQTQDKGKKMYNLERMLMH